MASRSRARRASLVALLQRQLAQPPQDAAYVVPVASRPRDCHRFSEARRRCGQIATVKRDLSPGSPAACRSRARRRSRAQSPGPLQSMPAARSMSPVMRRRLPKIAVPSLRASQSPPRARARSLPSSAATAGPNRRCVASSMPRSAYARARSHVGSLVFSASARASNASIHCCPSERWPLSNQKRHIAVARRRPSSTSPRPRPAKRRAHVA